MGQVCLFEGGQSYRSNCMRTVMQALDGQVLSMDKIRHDCVLSALRRRLFYLQFLTKMPVRHKSI